MATDPTGRISHLPDFHRGISWKQACRVASTATMTIATALNAGDVIDGVTLVAGDRILVKNQSTASQNGIYIAGATPVRAHDMDQDATTAVPAEEVLGAVIYIIAGTTNARTMWKNTNTTAPTIGSTSLTFVPLVSNTTPFFYPEDYGAIGDDTTDDDTAIHAAVTAASVAGGVVLFGPKTYKFTTTISISTPHVHLWGTGNEYGPTVLHMATANTTAISFPSSWADAARTYQSSVRDLMVKAVASSTNTVRGIYTKSNINLDNVGIDGFYDGLYWDNVTFYSRARGCFFTNQNHASVVMADTNNCTIDTSRITGDPIGAASLGSVDYGVFITATSPRGINNRIVNTSIEYFVLDGVYVDGGYSTLISGCYFETQQSSTGHAHIRIGPTRNGYANLLQSNYYQGDGTAGYSAIILDRAVGTVISDSTFGVNNAIGISSTGNASNVLLWNNRNSPAGTFTLPATSYTLDPAAPPLNNPMTTAGDTLYGTTGGSPLRLPIGTTGQAHIVSGGLPVWATAAGDVSGQYTALSVDKVKGVTVTDAGTGGEVLTKTAAGAATWSSPSSSSGAVDHEHIGDLFYSGDGATTAFELPAAPFDAYSVQAYVAGVRTDVTLSGTLLTTMTFGAAPASAANNILVDLIAAVA